LLTRHRLQAFSPEYFKNHHKLFTYSEENYEIAGTMLAGRKEPRAFLGTGLSEPDKTWKEVDLHGLCTFFSNPTKFLLNRRLGIYLEERSSLTEEREPFEVRTLEQYLLEDSMLRRRLQGRSLKDDLVFAVASGRLPHGPVGQCIYEGLTPGVEHFAEDLSPQLSKNALETLEFRIDVGGFSLTGSLDHVFKDKMVRFRYARLKGKDMVVSWIYHLMLNSVRAKGYPRHTLLAGLTGKGGRERKRLFYEYAPVDEGKEILERLLTRYWEGLKEPLHFFPESSWEYAGLRLAKGKPAEVALEQVRKAWEGDEWNRGEVEDPYYQLCFGKKDPIDKAFEKIAVELFEPLLKYLIKE